MALFSEFQGLCLRLTNAPRVLAIMFLLVIAASSSTLAQNGDADLRSEIDSLKSQIGKLESDIAGLDHTQRQLAEESGGIAIVLFLFGAFCALWAQSSGRSAWLWFFLGVIFHVIAVLFVLSKNGADLRQKDLTDRREKIFSRDGE